MFRRVAACEHSSGRCRPLGIFQDFDSIAGRLGFRHRVTQLRELLAWFNRNLKVPPRRVFRNGLGRCWFRTDSTEIRDRLWTWIMLLRSEGLRVRETASRNPGMITYRDEHQVVAVPYEHVPWRR